MENWKDIKEFGGEFQVSDRGRVRSMKNKTPRIVRRASYEDEKARVLISPKQPRHHKRLNNDKSRYVGPLVLTEFVGPAPPGAICRYEDEDMSNCNLSNLYWSC